MSTLTEFLVKNNIADLTGEVELTGRLAGFKFKIKTLTASENDEYTKVCQTITKNGEIKIDQKKYRTAILKNCVLEPDLKNAKMLEEANCRTPEEFINSRFNLGEQVKLQEAIFELSGLNTDINKDIEEAKN